MDRRRFATIGGLVAALTLGVREAAAQVSLADDIILAVQGEAMKQAAKRSELGRAPGATSPLFGTASYPTPLKLQAEHVRPHREFLLRTSRAPGDEMSQRVGEGGPSGGSPMSAPRLRLPPPIPEPADDTLSVSDLIAEDPGPPGGMTLDQALARLDVANNELRTKFHEIPMAEAEVLTAGLRENPLAFYDTTRIPYGSYDARRPGSIDHGVSIVYPIDYSGKRKAKVAAARAAKRVREAQYQDAVRLEIDNLYSIFVEVLNARDKARRAQESVRSLDQLMDLARQRGDREDIEDLVIDRETAAVRLEDERKRLLRAKQVLAESLALPQEVAPRLEPTGTMRDDAPLPPPVEDLIRLALARRPDVVAHRLGVPHAVAEVEKAKAERLPNAYLLYTPFGYTNRQAPGELDSRTWGIGVFLPLPLYDRNQGISNGPTSTSAGRRPS